MTALSSEVYIDAFCDLCSVKLKRRVDYEAHIIGHKHKWNVKNEILKEQHHASARTGPPHPIEYDCILCREVYYGARDYYTHILIRHARNSSPDNASVRYRQHGITVCRICNLELRGHMSYAEHMRSDYHRSAVKFKENKRLEQYPSRRSVGEFSGRSIIRNPIKNSTSGYPCKYCDAVHRSRSILNAHIFSEHPEVAKESV